MVRHIIDKKSPLSGHTIESLREGDASFSLTVMGLERTSMQPIFHLEVIGSPLLRVSRTSEYSLILNFHQSNISINYYHFEPQHRPNYDREHEF
jgi:hypothetical protein